MYNNEMKDKLVKEFTDNVDLNLEIVKSYGDLASCMRKDDAGMVKYLINETVKIMGASVPKELSIPAVSVYTSMSGDDSSVSIINLILKNKYTAEYEFRMKNKIAYSDDVFDVIINFLKCSYIELIIDTIIRKNLEVVNAKLEAVGKEAGNSFVVRVVSPLSSKGKKIVHITDDEVVFVADEDRALALDDILLLCEPNSIITEEDIKVGFDEEVSRFAQAQTTVQFVGVHDPLISYICDVSKLVKPYTLIKKVYPRNVEKLRGVKNTYAYFNRDGLFSVIYVGTEKSEVVLKPFNTETLEVVDIDVLGLI